MTQTTLDHYRGIWETYAMSWKADSREEKLTLFEQSLTEDCRYIDPLGTANGWQELADTMLGFNDNVPGGHFITTRFIAHHKKSIANWEMRNSEGTVLGDGISYGEYNEEGKLVAMTGFFDLPGN